ncbi:hypothetical protein [Spirosoma panaciterrae]|uniref:hypothetical protein n=1 Tax=Spirosoma panaciterrae TaxID=496058 RepID=UPI0003681253|nr:hypothetical protein [Spirosoma panaciterrae]
MLTVTTPSSQFTIPTLWEEVTLGQFRQIYSLETASAASTDDQQTVRYSIQEVLKILASDADALLDVQAREEVVILSHLSFLNQTPEFLSMPAPKRIAGVEPPSDLGSCTLRQKWMVDGLIQDMHEEGESVNYITMAIWLLSIYLYPLLTESKLTERKQLGLVLKQIESLPVTECLPLSAFFLSNYQRSTSTGQVSYSLSYPNRPPRPWLKRWYQNWRLTVSMRWLQRLRLIGT